VEKFGRWQEAWKQDHVTAELVTSFDDWLHGRVDGLKPGISTVPNPADDKTRPPYRLYTKYNVVVNEQPAETEPVEHWHLWLIYFGGLVVTSLLPQPLVIFSVTTACQEENLNISGNLTFAREFCRDFRGELTESLRKLLEKNRAIEKFIVNLSLGNSDL